MEDSLLMGFELDLLKGRTGEPIGTEKVWSGMTYVKTAMGWKPKGKIKEGKQEEVHQKRMSKLEQPSIPKEKQIENFADKAKDSQLKAAIKDPKQEEEVKKIAKEELEERKVSLEEDLDKKKASKKKELKIEDLSNENKTKVNFAKISVQAFYDIEEFLKKDGYSEQEIEIFLKKEVPNYSTMKLKVDKERRIGVGKDTVDLKDLGFLGPKLFKEIKSGELKDLSLFIELATDAGYGEDTVENFLEKEIPDFEKFKIAFSENSKKLDSKNFSFSETLDFKALKKENWDIAERFEGDLEKKGFSKEEIKEFLEKEIPGYIKGVEEYQAELRAEAEAKIKEAEAKEAEKERRKIKEEEIKEQKERGIAEAEIKEQTRQEAIKGDKEEKASYELYWLNEDVSYETEVKEKLIESVDKLAKEALQGHSFKEFKEAFEGYIDNPKRFLNVSNIMQTVSGDLNGKGLLIETIATQKALASLNKEMICLPFMYEEYNKEKYSCYDYILNARDDFEIDYDDDDPYPVGKITEHYQSNVPNLSEDQEEALSAYAGNSFYGFMTEYMFQNKDLEKISDLGKKRAIAACGTIEKATTKAESYINEINSYISENPISENVVLSRRINITKNPLIFDQITRLKKGDVDKMTSIQSFSYVQKAGFGDYQITLLAKAGDPIASANNLEEFEYVSKQGAQFKVLETGFNSMVIEFISDKEDLKKSLESDLLRRLQLPKQRIS